MAVMLSIRTKLSECFFSSSEYIDIPREAREGLRLRPKGCFQLG